MTMNPSSLQKVTARHLSRLAMLYVRQSTLHQVLENTESTALGYVSPTTYENMKGGNSTEKTWQKLSIVI